MLLNPPMNSGSNLDIVPAYVEENIQNQVMELKYKSGEWCAKCFETEGSMSPFSCKFPRSFSFFKAQCDYAKNEER